ncbi:CLUMA_CG014042, isoform A [Clunio marinus]|uniref:CLUMA_CG014042, isoform A n=1 Tax=Clunio marinus TaxID=568069 RepID=A0A1J1IMK2_9DIPT|nr:CLUMA_CG014042, isoform A [Clunio marinus]
MGVATLLLILLIAIIIYAIFQSGYFRCALLAFQIPGPKAIPFIGNCLIVKEKDLLGNIIATGYKTYGPISRLWFGFLPFFVIFEPEHLQQILSSHKHTEKSFLYKLLHNFLGDGLITSSGDKWLAHRKFTTPIFHINILEKFIETFSDSAKEFLIKLQNKNEINVTSFVNECIIDVLNESVLGVLVKEKQKKSPFREGKVVAPHRIANPWLLFDWIYQLTSSASDELDQKKRLDEFVRKIIQERRNTEEYVDDMKRKCLLDYLIDISKTHPDFDEKDIIDEACTFMLAGQDSVGATLAFTIFLLAQHQNHQAKCYDEIKYIFGDDERTPTINDLKEMKHLEMCIKETLRLYPAVPIMARHLGGEVKCGNVTLPSGSEIFVIPYATHRLEHIYPNPENFIPERFLPEECDKRNPYAFLPFSAGPRNCIGHRFAMIELKTIVSTILRKYRITSVPGKEIIEPSFRITLRARGGIFVQFEERNNNETSFENKNYNLFTRG